MKKIFFLALIFFFPIVVSAESIKSFHSDITPGSDGGFSVVETIVYDFEDEDRHGIFRTIPTEHPESGDTWFKKRIIDIDILSIKQDGAEAKYEVGNDWGEIDIKIGDPDSTITGEHIYEITYRVTGALFYYDAGGVDLYWNVTGNDWEVPMESVSAVIHDPSDVALDEASCYHGLSGEVNECDVAVNGAAEFGPVSLDAGEGMTIARALNSEKVERQILETWSIWPLWLLGAVLWLMWLAWFLVRYVRQYKTGASIIAQYEPYQNLGPMYTGVIFDGRVDPHDITAGIVRLAEKGFLKVRHIGRKMFFVIEVDDYELQVLRPYSELETEFDRTLFKLLFKETAAIGDKVVLSEMAKDYSKRTENLGLLQNLSKAAEQDLIKDGFWSHEWRVPLKMIGTHAIVILFLLGITSLIGADLVAPIIIAAFTFFISSMFTLIAYRRRTRKGYEALDHLKGFKEFLSVTDKERFKFHNAPQKSPEQFMEYLPYAIAFGVEKEWANVFRDVTIPAPSWYDGNGHAFNAIYLSQSLGTFGDSVASAGGYSASSGGGSSGGGAGGGGGGSW